MPIHDMWPTGFTTKLDFTLCKVGKNLWLAWTDAEGGVQLAHSQPPASGKIVWTLKDEVAAGVTTGPSIVMGSEGYLTGIVVAYGNAKGNVEVIQIDGGYQNTLDDTTSQRPSLAWWTARLWIAWTGDDGHLHTAFASEKLEFGNLKTYDDDTSFASPGLGGNEVNLTLGWTGTNDRRSVFIADVDADGDLHMKELDDDDGSATGVAVSGSPETIATWASADHANQICIATNPLQYDAKFTRDPLTSNVTPFLSGGFIAYTDANDEIWVGRF